MKRRHRHLLNLFSVGLLAVALYLNFIKKESESISSGSLETIVKPNTAGLGETKIATSKASIQTLVLK